MNNGRDWLGRFIKGRKISDEDKLKQIKQQRKTIE